MDLESVSGPKYSESIRTPVVREGVEPVEGKHPVQRSGGSSHTASMTLWDSAYKVTISARARRKYREMLEDR